MHVFSRVYGYDSLIQLLAAPTYQNETHDSTPFGAGLLIRCQPNRDCGVKKEGGQNEG